MKEHPRSKGGNFRGPERLNEMIGAQQKRLANHLNFRCRNIPSKALLILLILFTVIITVILLGLIVNAIHSPIK